MHPPLRPIDQRPRFAGLLLHPTSLPAARDSVLDEALDLLAWLARAGLGAWMMLPIHPPGADGSPYMGRSAFALDPGLLRPGDFPRLLELLDLPAPTGPPPTCAEDLLPLFLDHPEARTRLAAFRTRHAAWLAPWAAFALACDLHGAPWTQWPPALRTAHPDLIDDLRNHNSEAFLLEEIRQLLTFRLWAAIRQRATSLGIELIGDAPLYVAHHSAEVWWRPDLFELDAQGHPLALSGVPPDAFSATGQRWGHPLYRWHPPAPIFAWWRQRLGLATTLFDRLRIDHFRGLVDYWRIPCDAPDASTGTWEPGPGRPLFDALTPTLPLSALIAEDLGIIDDRVRELRRSLGLPGMHVLHFGFEGDATNPHRPENHEPCGVVFTGTHDNATTVEWWNALEGTAAGAVLRHAPAMSVDPAGALIDLALASKAGLAILPAQDVLRFGADQRMNRPGTTHGNWNFRLAPGALDAHVADEMRDRIRRSDRCSSPGSAGHGRGESL